MVENMVPVSLEPVNVVEQDEVTIRPNPKESDRRRRLQLERSPRTVRVNQHLILLGDSRVRSNLEVT